MTHPSMKCASMKRPPVRRYAKILALALAASTLAGCATMSDDGGFDDVSKMTVERTGQPVQRFQDAAANRASVQQIAAQPLTPDSSVRIALLNNRGLQASLADLGVAEADLVQAGRMRNPGFSYGRIQGGGEVEIDRSVMFDLAGLLTMPLRRDIEGKRFEQAKLAAAAQAVALATDTRIAYFNAVAARQSADYAEQVKGAAEAAAELAQRMANVGNWSRLDQAREQVFYADATTQLAHARHTALATREQLTRLLGLWGEDTAYVLPQRLPDLPATANQMPDIEALAIAQRLDIQMARRDTEAMASALGLSKATGFINVLDVGYQNKSTTGQPRANGYQIALELPIFDWGTARNSRAEARYMQAVHHTADIAIRARSEVRVAYSGYRTGFDVATHYRNEVLPLRKRISNEVLLRYNGMLASVFELLSDSKDQIASVNATITAQRDFWIADTVLQAAINGGGGGGGGGNNAAGSGQPQTTAVAATPAH
jgi:outer membrane protein TolC